eukprot:5285253-Amphidinium_carterae.1
MALETLVNMNISANLTSFDSFGVKKLLDHRTLYYTLAPIVSARCYNPDSVQQPTSSSRSSLKVASKQLVVIPRQGGKVCMSSRILHVLGGARFGNGFRMLS